ncbi:LacI family DNA-binding transcriptional regulator [Leifsonia poae]|uniref:LacI family DNA-binding transcriptional regulator n=1 Tax=Leifsonia poae TaxID=110933 RepID=UPI001CBF67B2|nr:LacI family DNA-binding transcriptional regulator [Leifsonia poae]
MASSAEVAAHAGVSRSTVSQILNGHGNRFTPDMVQRVESTARKLGYRPSVAARTLARGTSDIVITLIPNITFGPRLRDLIDTITRELADAGLTNLLRLASSDESFEDSILALRPRGLWSLAPLTREQRSRLHNQGVQVIDQSHDLQVAIDREIGAIQAAHLVAAGYERIAAAMPTDQREMPYANARVDGALNWCADHGIEHLPTLHLDMTRGGPALAARLLDSRSFGVAAYNDDVALAVLGAATRAGRPVPDDIGVIGVDNSTVAMIATPSITTVDLDLTFSGHEIVRALLDGPDALPTEPFEIVRRQISVVQGESTPTPPPPAT